MRILNDVNLKKTIKIMGIVIAFGNEIFDFNLLATPSVCEFCLSLTRSPRT